jgi:hypothetical protein
MGGEGLHARQQAIDKAVENGVAIADMPVDRGDSHAKIIGESTHGEGIDAMTFDDAASGEQHIIGSNR